LKFISGEFRDAIKQIRNIGAVGAFGRFGHCSFAFSNAYTPDVPSIYEWQNAGAVR